MLIYLSYRFYTDLTSLFQRESWTRRSDIRMKWSDIEMIYRLRFKRHFSRREDVADDVVELCRRFRFCSIWFALSYREDVPIEQVASVIDINRSPVRRFVFIFVFVGVVFISVDSRVPVEFSCAFCRRYCFISNCALIDVLCNIDGSGLFFV